MKRVVSLLIITFICTAQLFPYKEMGSASYYDNRLHGRKTASGERYNKQRLTCAHRSLPFGTLLKVSNLHNDKVVFVVVNDRGPFHSKRVIDLSYQAAQKIDLTRSGVAPVQIEVVKALPLELPPPPFQLSSVGVYLQLNKHATFTQLKNKKL